QGGDHSEHRNDQRHQYRAEPAQRGLAPYFQARPRRGRTGRAPCRSQDGGRPPDGEVGLQMDGVITYPEARTADQPPRPQPAPGMPPESPVPMPEQKLRQFEGGRKFVDPKRSRSRLLPRIVVLGGGAAITAFASFAMGKSLALGGLTILEAVVLFLFTV